MDRSNASSISITSSTVSRESAPRSFTNDEVFEILSLATPSCLETISMTLVSISAADAIAPPSMGFVRGAPVNGGELYGPYIGNSRINSREGVCLSMHSRRRYLLGALSALLVVLAAVLVMKLRTAPAPEEPVPEPVEAWKRNDDLLARLRQASLTPSGE